MVIEKLLSTIDASIKQAMRRGVNAAEASLTQQVGFSVTARMGEVETLEHHQSKGLVITVYQNQRVGSTSTSDLSPNAVISAVEKACTIAQYSGQDPYAGLADPALLAFNYPQLDLFHHWDITPAKAIQMAIECETIARNQDKRIIPSEGASISTGDYFRIYANSDGFVGHYQASEHSISCTVVAESGQQMQRDHEYTVARKPEMLDDIAYVATHAAQKTLHRLGARKLKTQRCPVIFHAPVAKSLLRSFISAISGSNLYREFSFLLNSLNTQVFPSHINIYQQPHLLSGLGSAAFDSDGVKTQDRHYVENGVVKSYVLGSYSARKLGMQTTGNSGGVYNLTINTSDLNLPELFKKMDKGLFITEFMGQGVNILTGDYSRGVSGFWIENGEIQYPVEEITIADNLKNMYQNIITVANDVDHRSNIRTGSILIKEIAVAGE